MKTTNTAEKPVLISSLKEPRYTLRIRRGSLWEDCGSYKTPGAAMQGYFALGRKTNDSVVVINHATRIIIVSATVMNEEG